MSQLLELDDPVGAVRQTLRDEMTQRVASLEATLANSDESKRVCTKCGARFPDPVKPK